MKRKKKSNIVNWLLIIIFLAGVALLLYPTVSNQWNLLHQSRAIAGYAEAVSQIDDEEYERILQAARAYNQELPNRTNRYSFSPEEQAEYERMLNISGNGVMGYMEIPKIQVTLPVYHGTSAEVLQVAVGHLSSSSLPVGGAGTHCVVSGHRGLPSAKLFTNLDQLAEGDLFMLQILDETLTYEVDRILIVEPEDVENLNIEEGKDYCTLVTCTPYGINSHRMLVRGHRVDNQEEAATVRVIADAVRIEPVLVAPAVAAPVLLILLIWLLAGTSGGGKKRTVNHEKEPS